MLRQAYCCLLSLDKWYKNKKEIGLNKLSGTRFRSLVAYLILPCFFNPMLSLCFINCLAQNKYKAPRIFTDWLFLSKANRSMGSKRV